MKIHNLIIIIPLLFACEKNPAQSKDVDTKINSIQTIIDDMALCGEALPHGVPTSYEWAKCPKLGAGNNPKHMRAVLPWGQLFATVKGDKTINTRVQIRNLYVYYISKATNKWTLWTGAPSVAGAYYVENFSNDTFIPAADVRKEASGGVSVRLVPNYNYHFWSENGRKTINPDDIKGVWAYCEARLVMDNPSKLDDRSQAEFILSAGSDYWLDLTAKWVSSWYNNGDVGIGRFKYVTSDWKAFNMHSLTPQEIQSNPPPFK